MQHAKIDAYVVPIGHGKLSNNHRSAATAAVILDFKQVSGLGARERIAEAERLMQVGKLKLGQAKSAVIRPSDPLQNLSF